VIVGAMVIGSWLSNLKKNSQKQRRRDEGHNPQQLEEMAARRREQLRRANRDRTQTQAGGLSRGGGAPGQAEPGNMTMAERIARARAKAQYEQRSGGSSGQASAEVGPEALDPRAQARARQQAELARRRKAAQAQQEQAQQHAQQQARRQAQQQRAQRQAQQQRTRKQRAHTQAKARARQQGTLIHEHVAVPDPTNSTTKRLVPTRPDPRPKARAAQAAGNTLASGALFSGGLSRDDLRRAIVLNEVLGKPLALRQDEGGSL